MQVCINHVFGEEVEPYLKLHGCKAINQQWIFRRGVQ